MAYDAEGDYPHTYTSEVSGCDSIVTLHLTQLESTDSIEIVSICAGETYTWHEQAFTEAITKIETLTNAAGCDSVCTLILSVSEPTDSVETVTICAGETHTWHGRTFTATTTQEETLTNAAGCDSVCTLQLTVLPQLTEDTTAYICQGEEFTWHDITYTSDIDVSHTYTSKVTGCDSIVTLKLIEWPTYDMPAEDTTIIDGETYTWNGKEYGIDVYERPGLYQDKLTLPTAHGCDSIVYLNLTVLENNVENVAINIAEQCAGEGVLEIAIQHTGYLTDAQLTFDEKARQAGFENGTYPIENDTVTIPYNVKAGIFSVNIDLLFHNRLKYSTSEPEPFTLLFPSSVLEQRWMDAIFVLTHDYNGEYDFADFQWYKKGQKLVGETGPYLYQPLEVGAEYSAMLTEVNLGIRLMTCPLIVTEHTDITLYPTIVTRRDMLRVHVSQDALITMYSLMGERVSARALIHGDTQIEAPTTQGVYLAEVVLESGLRKVFKIMVR